MALTFEGNNDEKQKLTTPITLLWTMIAAPFSCRETLASQGGWLAAWPDMSVRWPGCKGDFAFLFQENNEPTAETYATAEMGHQSSTDQMSVCSWIKVDYFRRNTYVYSYATSDQKSNEVNMKVEPNALKIAIGEKYSIYKERTNLVIPKRWLHACFVCSPSDMTLKIYVNGNFKTSENRVCMITLNGTVVLGQETDSYVGGFDKLQSFSGYIMDYNMYNRTLTDKEVKALGSCNGGLEKHHPGEGDLVAWSKTEWNVVGAVKRDMTKEVICQSFAAGRNQYLNFPHLFNHDEGTQLCGVLKGHIALPRSEAENDVLYQFVEPIGPLCKNHIHYSGFLWLGTTDKAVEGEWRSMKTGNVLEYTNFVNEINQSKQDCALLLMAPVERKWDDVGCFPHFKFCLACDVEKDIILTLRGLCEEEPIAALFLTENSENTTVSFSGFMNYKISLRESTWILFDSWTQEVVAQLDAHELVLPIGTHVWTLTTNYSICSKTAESSHLLTLSACLENEYTCKDGSCISLEQRCDLRLDCPDASDETGCQKLILPDEYFPELPPPGLSGEPLRMDATVNVFGFSQIDTMDMRITIDFEYRLSWFDQRLQYINLKNSSDLNLIEGGSVWTPKILMPNAEFPRIQSTPPVTSILRTAAPLPDNIQNAVRDEQYSGSQNPLMWQQQINAPFACSMDLRNFPFDTQHCQLHLKLASADSEYIEWGNVTTNYLGPVFMSEHDVSDWQVERSVVRGYSLVSISFALHRRFSYYITSAYLPTFMLIAISYASLFCKHENIDLRVMMSITILLVLYALYQQITSGLPRTSYTKAIDVWCFFALTFIFTQVIFHVMIDVGPVLMMIHKCTHRRKTIATEEPPAKKRSPIEQTYYYARIIYVIIFLVFFFIYWTVVLS
ncbi:uncharacterized protein LOC143020498 [Oratosquilla oratoria]|uniref:uncharacterized protein LOC143020498 n=1 Tax=Oratosquilla oratoria TaxID=337810 RepID=UPI003F763304